MLFSYGVFSCGALRARASLFMGADFDPRDEVAVLMFLDPRTKYAPFLQKGGNSAVEKFFEIILL